jgi:hypothetical protein
MGGAIAAERASSHAPEAILNVGCGSFRQAVRLQSP